MTLRNPVLACSQIFFASEGCQQKIFWVNCAATARSHDALCSSGCVRVSWAGCACFCSTALVCTICIRSRAWAALRQSQSQTHSLFNVSVVFITQLSWRVSRVSSGVKNEISTAPDQVNIKSHKDLQVLFYKEKEIRCVIPFFAVYCLKFLLLRICFRASLLTVIILSLLDKNIFLLFW